MAVSADEGAVETDVARGECGNGGYFCREEVLFAHTVLPVEVVEHGELELILDVLVRIGHCADNNVELFALYHLCAALCHLFAAEVGQKVVDIEYGVVRLFADVKLYLSAVFEHNHAVQGEGYGCPLVLLDSAIVVRLQKAHTRLLIQRILLYIYPGRVDVRSDYAQAVLFEVFASHAEHHHALAAVYEVLFIARGELVAEFEFGEARLPCHSYRGGAGLALGLGLVEEGLITFGIGEHLRALLFGGNLEIVLLFIGKFVVTFLPFALLLCHMKKLLKIFNFSHIISPQLGKINRQSGKIGQ